jgi:hypothetical protein
MFVVLYDACANCMRLCSVFSWLCVWLNYQCFRLTIFICPITCIKVKIFSCRNQRVHIFKDVQLYSCINYTDVFRSILWSSSGCCTVSSRPSHCARLTILTRSLRPYTSLLLLLLAFTTHLRVLAFSFLRFRDHTQWHTTVGRTPLDEWSARRRDLYLTNTQHSQQTSMPAAGFEPAIPAGERLQTHALDRLVIGIGIHIPKQGSL